MGITEITVAAGWIAGLAILALIATGWRKTARAAADPARGPSAAGAPSGREVVEEAAPIDRPFPLLRRFAAAATGGALAVLTGAALATLVGFGVAYGVVTLTHMLKR